MSLVYLIYSKGKVIEFHILQSFPVSCLNHSKQMKKCLEQQGASFQQGKGSHLKVFLNGKQTTLPMHGAAELGKGLEAAIKRQLDLK